jgi:hypothetical protein
MYHGYYAYAYLVLVQRSVCKRDEGQEDNRECMSSGAQSTVLYKRRIQAAKVRLIKRVKQCARYNRMSDEISVRQLKIALNRFERNRTRRKDVRRDD